MSNLFYVFNWRHFSKSWTPSFLPYPCSSGCLLTGLYCFVYPQNGQLTNSLYQPLCVSFYYIIYIVSIRFLSNMLYKNNWRQFSKSWAPSFLPYPCSVHNFQLCFIVVLFQNNSTVENYKIPTPVCFFLLYYIYSRYMLFWEQFFYFMTSANFQKAGRLHSCLIMLAHNLFSVVIVFLFHKKTRQRISYRTNPCLFLFIILYIYSKCMAFWVLRFVNFYWRQFSKSWTPSFLPYSAR